MMADEDVQACTQGTWSTRTDETGPLAASDQQARPPSSPKVPNGVGVQEPQDREKMSGGRGVEGVQDREAAAQSHVEVKSTELASKSAELVKSSEEDLRLAAEKAAFEGELAVLRAQMTGGSAEAEKYSEEAKRLAAEVARLEGELSAARSQVPDVSSALEDQVIELFGDVHVLDTPDGAVYIGNAVSAYFAVQLNAIWSHHSMTFCNVSCLADFCGTQNCNLPHGTGLSVWQVNDALERVEYLGHFGCGRKTGLGVMRFRDGTSYLGEFKAGKPHGYGKETYPDGSEYTGQFQNDTRHGEGRYVCADGSVAFAGTWCEGQQDGVGFVQEAVCVFHR